MTALREAVSELLEAQERFFDAFEDAVVAVLGEPERLALQGSENSGEGRDRLSLMLPMLRHTEALRNCLLDAEEDEAQQLAKAWVKIAASDIVAKSSTNAPRPSQEKAERILTEMAAVGDPNPARELATL